MADEQTIYLSPEEELTSVRERLERTQARRIILVIPQQTSLRSHVGWRLIHARMRELGKELLVISPDRQVRAVARAAGFRVAETQEPPSNRSRLGGGTRPGSQTTRGGARSRVGGSRGGPQSRLPQQPTGRRKLTPSASSRPALPPSVPTPSDYEEEATLERPGKKKSEAGGSQPFAPATLFEQPGEKFGPAYDFHIDTTPSVRPSMPQREEEDDEDSLSRKYYEDYQQAQHIRESASGSGLLSGQSEPSSRGAQESRGSGASRWKLDPYAYIEDEPPPISLPEQKGSVHGPLEEAEAGGPDISDRSTEIMESEIEDLGDLGALDLPQADAPEQRPASRLREQQARPRPRTGQMQPRRSPRAPRSDLQDLNDDEDLLPLPPVQSPPARSSKGLAGAAPRQSQALASGASSQASARPRSIPLPAPQSTRPPGRQLISVPGPASRPSVAPRRPRRRPRGLLVALLTIVILLVAGILLFWLVPSATVTISLRSRTFSQNVQFNASADPQASAQNRVPAQILQHDFSASGQGTASGTTRVGNAKASGLVTFTNNGNTDVIVPSGTIITTASGVQFATGAEAAIPHGSSLPAMPVTAQQSGEVGNVPANSITFIPQPSINNIAQYNHTSPANINLAVSNDKATSGGGATNAPAVTTRDIQALVRTLHKKLQQQVSDWLGQQLHQGDMRGALVPDVLNSDGPLSQEQLSGAPDAGSAANNGTFNGTLSLHISVLVARAADLQKAAAAQLNAAAAQLRPASMLATRLPVTLSNSKSTPSKDGKSLAITAKATGEIVNRLDTQAISAALTGKGVSEVTGDLKSSLAQAGIQNVQVNVSPSFLSIMPLQAGRIQIILQPLGPVPAKNVPNG